MKITDITAGVKTIPLVSTFRTSLRAVDSVDNVIVTLHVDNGQTGYGSGAPAAVITGETISSIMGGIEHIRDALVGMDLRDSEALFQQLNGCLVGNMSAKAAVDMAVYDLIARSLNIPLFRLLGGRAQEVETDITISLDTTEAMVTESRRRVAEGFQALKIKVGKDMHRDLERLEHIGRAVQNKASLRIDANQGWTGKEAVEVARFLVQKGITVELIEQPVPAGDTSGLRFVRENASQAVYADESVFSPQDALELISQGAVDGINIKLMKCGGIYNALKIAAIADTAGIPCMIGSMMECHISVTAAAHLAVSRRVFRYFDLDAPLFCSENPASGGISYRGARVVLSDEPGLGITAVSI